MVLLRGQSNCLRNATVDNARCVELVNKDAILLVKTIRTDVRLIIVVMHPLGTKAPRPLAGIVVHRNRVLRRAPKGTDEILVIDGPCPRRTAVEP
jgi:hypothetical protein